MSTPEDPETLAADLFRAAKDDRPSGAARERLVDAMLREVHNAPAEALGDEHVESTPSGSRTSWRWLAVAAVVTALVATLLVVRTRRDVSVAIQPVSSAQHEHGKGAAVPPTVAPVESATPAPVRDAAVPEKPVFRRRARDVRDVHVEPSAEPPRPPASLQEEITALDRARTALARGDFAGTLQSLDDYDRVLHGTRLREEATLLRIELLAKSGRTADASAMASRFVADNPGSSLAERARRFLERRSDDTRGQVGNRVDAGGLP